MATPRRPSPRVNVSVGTRSIRGSQRSSVVDYTRIVRQQMKGIQHNLDKIIRQVENVTPEALDYAVRPIYEQSQVYCPVDTGALKESGYLVVRRDGKRGAQVEVGYGRAGKPFYAVFVHEMMDLYHEPPTRAKWLESAFKEGMDQIPVRLAEYIRNKVNS